MLDRPRRFGKRGDRAQMGWSQFSVVRPSTRSNLQVSVTSVAPHESAWAAMNVSFHPTRAASMMIRSPYLRITASVPGNSNSRAMRTARLRPFLNSLTGRSQPIGVSSAYAKA
jgi:hypothetical protein